MRTTTLRSNLATSGMLRKVLFVDGAMSGAVGIVLIAAAGPLSDTFGLSTAFLRWTGLILLPWVLALLLLANRTVIPRGGVMAVIGVNLAWVAASFIIMLLGWVNPSTAGVVFIVAQALLVTAFADLQFMGLLRSNR